MAGLFMLASQLTYNFNVCVCVYNVFCYRGYSLLAKQEN